MRITPEPVGGVYKVGDTVTCSGKGDSPSFYWTVTSDTDKSPPPVNNQLTPNSVSLTFDASWVGQVYTLKCTGMNLVQGSRGYISSWKVTFSVGMMMCPSILMLVNTWSFS